jgi:AraC-like DNA-binding protein
MAFRVHRPDFPLSGYVEQMWWRAYSGLAPSLERVYPDGSMVLVIHLRRPTISYVIDEKSYSIRVPVLAGPYSRFFFIDPSLSTAVLGIVFRPGAARVFFPIAANELENVDISLADLDPLEADRLLNDLCPQVDAAALFRAAELYLERKLKNAPPIDPVVEFAARELARQGRVRTVREVQMEAGLSHTRFIQLFHEHVGLTPKLFARIRRFRHALARMEGSLPVHWAGLAADCGYFDQAHLIRDFRAFAGATPLELSHTLSRRGRPASPVLPH